jgi:hypothetical protein
MIKVCEFMERVRVCHEMCVFVMAYVRVYNGI